MVDKSRRIFDQRINELIAEHNAEGLERGDSVNWDFHNRQIAKQLNDEGWGEQALLPAVTAKSSNYINQTGLRVNAQLALEYDRGANVRINARETTTLERAFRSPRLLLPQAIAQVTKEVSGATEIVRTGNAKIAGLNELQRMAFDGQEPPWIADADEEDPPAPVAA